MGNLCQVHTDDPTVYNNGERPISSTMRMSLIQLDDSQNERINQIKQFLTLTSQNVESFYDVSQSNIKQNPHQNQVQPKSINDFTVVRGLGKGAFGQVYLVKDKQKHKCYAMKIIPKEKVRSQQQKIHTLSERYILQAMDHPFIVKLHFAFQTKNKLYLLVDLMSGGQLFYLLRRNKKFPQSVAKFYAAQILLALQYLHSRNIIYRDLKPQNILLDKEGHIKLADFGLSKVCYSKNQMAYSMCGTPEYIAPEIILGKGYTNSADWFSYGSLIYDMLTGKPPFYSKNKHEILKNITSKPVPLPQTLSEDAKSLLKQLFKIKPKDRLGNKFGAKQIKQHKFFSQINFDQLLKKQVKPPITFIQSDLNDEGFDQNFEQNISSSLFEDKTYKGVAYDGFTYFKPEIQSLTRDGNQIEALKTGQGQQILPSPSPQNQQKATHN